jgi:DNA-directed RNA polymerase beta' subunit
MLMLLHCMDTGNGTIEQAVNLSSEYYIAVRNLNDHQDTTVN